MTNTKQLRLTAKRGLTTGPFELTKVGLQVRGEPTLGQWKKAGEFLQQSEGAVHWWVGDWLRHGAEHYEHGQYEKAIEVLPFEKETLKKDRQIAEGFESGRRRPDLSWSHHREVMPLSEPDQERWLDKAEKEGLSSRALRQEIKAERIANTVTPELPEGTYNLVLADPPWRYEFSKSDSRKIENQYPTMELGDICALDIKSISHDDCVLFMWATSPKLADSMEVLTGWGFEYKTCMIWAKDKIGMGYYARQRHELLLIATRGTPSVPSPSDRPDSVIEAPREEHSRKPDVFYGVIEKMYPKSEKVELFCRRPRDGWTAWGNQV